MTLLTITTIGLVGVLTILLVSTIYHYKTYKRKQQSFFKEIDDELKKELKKSEEVLQKPLTPEESFEIRPEQFSLTLEKKLIIRTLRYQFDSDFGNQGLFLRVCKSFAFDTYRKKHSQSKHYKIHSNNSFIESFDMYCYHKKGDEIQSIDLKRPIFIKTKYSEFYLIVKDPQ
jgi:hypothetical protein